MRVIYFLLNMLAAPLNHPDPVELYNPMKAFRYPAIPEFGTQESPCRNGHNLDISVKWLHIQAQAGYTSTNSWGNEVTMALSRVANELDRRYNMNVEGEYVGDRIEYSLAMSIDKRQAYIDGLYIIPNGGGPVGQCNRKVYSKLKYKDLRCPCAADPYICPPIQKGISYLLTYRSVYPHRYSIFDPIIDFIQEFITSDDPEPLEDVIPARVVTVITDQCGRISGRTAGLTTEQKNAYWSSNEPEFVEGWKNNPGISAQGVTSEANCELRDYPTLSELFNGLKAANTGLLVLMASEDVFGVCNDIDDYDKDTFYAQLMRHEADKHGVKYAFYHFTGHVSLSESMLYGLVEVMDPCRND